jgi:hypothetical protein
LVKPNQKSQLGYFYGPDLVINFACEELSVPILLPTHLLTDRLLAVDG